MIGHEESFHYDYEEQDSPDKVIGVTVNPLSAEYLAWRLQISEMEAEDLRGLRAERQREHMPRMVGEFVIDSLGFGEPSLQRAHISAVTAHAESLGLPEQVYGGFHGFGFLRHGVLLTDTRDTKDQATDSANRLHAICPAQWLENAGSSIGNPFYHMDHGRLPGRTAPVVASFAQNLLESDDGTVWHPKAGLRAAETLQVVYHRGLLSR